MLWARGFRRHGSWLTPVRGRACVAAVLAACAAVGCVSDNIGQHMRGTSSEPRKLTLAEEVRLDEAEELLIKACMERRGFRYWLGLVEGVAARRTNGYVTTDVATARQHGYGGKLREQMETRKRHEPNIRYANALPEAERRRYGIALFGDPETGTLTIDLPAGGTISKPNNGCLAEAESELYGDLSAWVRAEKVAMGVTSLYVSDLLDDPRFVAALRTWSECMSEAGHNYRTPAEIRQRLPELKAGATPEQAHYIEVRLATAEATCATATSLASAARRLDQEYRAARLAPYQAEINTYERMRVAAVMRIEDLFGPDS